MSFPCVVNRDVIRNRYSFFEHITLGISYIFTRLFFPKAKLVCYPVYMRGKESLEYGEGFNIGYGCRFDLINTSKKTLFIGQNFEAGDYCHFVALNEVIIGDNVLFASKIFVSDTHHGIYKGKDCSSPYEKPNDRVLATSSVHIGNNVWIGDNVVILPGSYIGDGCIVGANSVVTGEFGDNSIIAGTPAKVLKVFDMNSRKWEKVK